MTTPLESTLPYLALAVALGLTLGLAPGVLLSAFTLVYPKQHPRRRELMAEFEVLSRRQRPLWVLGQAETALRDGLPTRWRAGTPSERRWRETRLSLFGSLVLSLAGVALQVPYFLHPETISKPKLIAGVALSIVSFASWSVALTVHWRRRHRSRRLEQFISLYADR
jgi:hypothetical protein